MTDPTRVSAEIKITEAKAGLYTRIGAGLFLMLAGAATFAYGVYIDNHYLMIGGASFSVFGAMILPSVFDAAKPVISFVIPYVPWLGGRRAGDPQPGVSQGNSSNDGANKS